MKKINLKRVVCLSVSLATVLTAGGMALADETGVEDA